MRHQVCCTDMCPPPLRFRMTLYTSIFFLSAPLLSLIPLLSLPPSFFSHSLSFLSLQSHSLFSLSYVSFSHSFSLSAFLPPLPLFAGTISSSCHPSPPVKISGKTKIKKHRKHCIFGFLSRYTLYTVPPPSCTEGDKSKPFSFTHVAPST